MIIIRAETAEHFTQAREIFREYAESLAYHICFESFEKELAELETIYAPPRGALLLAMEANRAAGCVALRPFGEPGVGEVKRLYVRSNGRGRGIGLTLGRALVEAAKGMDYEGLVLDTLPNMTAAHAVYGRLGFEKIPPVGERGLDVPIVMRLKLTS